MNPSFKDPLPPQTRGPFREGDRVRLLWGVTPVEGIVIEDRGNLGVGGRRFYRIRIRHDDITEPSETERPAEDLTLIARPPTPSRKARRGKRGSDHPPEGPSGAPPGRERPAYPSPSRVNAADAGRRRRQPARFTSDFSARVHFTINQ